MNGKGKKCRAGGRKDYVDRKTHPRKKKPRGKSERGLIAVYRNLQKKTDGLEKGSGRAPTFWGKENSCRRIRGKLTRAVGVKRRLPAGKNDPE